ncbi:hypothetical protein KKE19_03695 [Patescibacteria group bacterium]|nr:hypothetical protein [Patescibacteria group bacterium]MBU4274888.1 hypothetical protein [Patescibacteria group bacterium]MBU4367355.1 hypothetical protein [Patescibacteria group bacterium]MBU4461974.1 hypothetical protein [Patescibacteria group bacterium]MCG2699655.1 hypothetical protein [Candidatus Parcubacteria bacterium]
MINRNLCLVESVARAVIKITKLKHSQELLGMFPVDLCQTMIADGNVNQIIAKVNRLWRKKEDAFALAADLGLDWKNKAEKRKKMQKMVDSSSDKLTLTQKVLQRQIKFLAALSRSIYELKFIKK